MDQLFWSIEDGERSKPSVDVYAILRTWEHFFWICYFDPSSWTKDEDHCCCLGHLYDNLRTSMPHPFDKIPFLDRLFHMFGLQGMKFCSGVRTDERGNKKGRASERERVRGRDTEYKWEMDSSRSVARGRRISGIGAIAGRVAQSQNHSLQSHRAL